MMTKPFSRREFLLMLPVGASLFYPSPAQKAISSNGYNWITFYQRGGKVWGQDWDACIQDYAHSGLKALEPSIGHVDDLNKLIPALKKYDMPWKHASDIKGWQSEWATAYNVTFIPFNFLINI